MSEKWLNDDELKEILGEQAQDPLLESDLLSLLDDKDEEDEDEGGFLPKKEVLTKSVNFEELTEEEELLGEENEFELLFDVPLEVRALLGSVEKTIEEILKMKKGSIVEIEKLAGEPVEVVVGDQVIARGEIVIMNDKFGVLITEIVPPRERIKSVESKLKRQKQ